MDEQYVITSSARAESWKKKYLSKKDPVFGRIVTNTIIALVLAGCILLVFFVDTPVTTGIRSGLESVFNTDLDFKDTLGEIFYIEGWSNNEQVSGNGTVNDLLYMPASGTVTASDDGESPSVLITCDRYIGVYATASGTVENVLTPSGGGKVLMLRHEDGMLSIYTGCDAVYVSKGDTVTRKQLLGSVQKGEQGYVLQYQLMSGEQALDPMQYIEYAGADTQ